MSSPRCCTCMAVRIRNQIHGWRCVLRTMSLIMIARMHVCAFMYVYMFVSMYVPMYVCRCVCTPWASCLWALQEPPGHLGFFSGLYCGCLVIVGPQPTLMPAPLAAQSARHTCNGEVVFRKLFSFSSVLYRSTQWRVIRNCRQEKWGQVQRAEGGVLDGGLWIHILMCVS